MTDTILEIRNICKSFSGVPVLEDINMSIKKGEVHVIVGENGAGKSTLMKIISGVYRKDKGELFFELSMLVSASFIKSSIFCPTGRSGRTYFSAGNP